MGAGKSVLTYGWLFLGLIRYRSVVISKLTKIAFRNSRIGVAFFYCDANNSEKQEARYILGSLVKQLLPTPSLGEGSTLMEHLESLYERNGCGGSPPLDTLLFTLEWISSTYERVYVIIDGLDECDKRKSIVKHLSKLVTNVVNLFVTSRPETDIEKAFEGRPNMTMDDEQLQQDITAHVKWTLDNDEDFADIAIQLKDEIAQKLQQKNAGMYFPGRQNILTRRFRWVQCQLDDLKEQEREVDIRSSLDNLPSGLPATYHRILERIGKARSRGEIARKALVWLICCKRPLRLHELSVAIAIDPNDQYFDSGKTTRHNERVLQICGSLVKLNKNNEVQIGHFSVIEYLTSPKMPDGTVNVHFVDVQLGNDQLLKCCLTYLSFPQFQNMYGTEEERNTRLRENALLEYASIEWPSHGCEIDAQPSQRRCMTGFLQRPDGEAFLAWSQLWQYDAEQRWILFPRVQQYTGIYFATLFGLCGVVEDLLNGDGSVALATIGHAMVASGFNGKPRLIKRLLSAGGEIAIQDEDGWTALHHAVWKEHMEAVETLVEAGADLKIQDGNGETALHMAVRNGHTPIVKILVAAAPDLNIQDGYKGTALYWGVRSGHADSVNLLIHAGADLNTQDEYGGTALYWAAKKNFMEIIKALAAAGADFNIQDDCGDTALHVAVRNGHTDVVKFAVKAGADLNIEDNDGGTAVYWAAKNGHSEVVKILVEAEANLNISDKEGGTAVYWAAKNGHSEVIKILVEAGASLNISDKEGGTAVYWAARNGHIEVIMALMEGRADLSIQADDGRTALYWAERKERTEVVKILVKGGAT